MRAVATVLALLAPVGGPVTRGFDYGSDPFLAGQHRGIDLAAPPGTVVRAACPGTVAVARMAVVTLRCGPWRVTELPLASVEVRVGTRVRAGDVVGRAGALTGHAGVHLGVRRAGDPFAYVDPEPLLRGVPAEPPVVGAPARVPREGPRSAAGSAPAVAHSAVLPARPTGGVRVSAGTSSGALAPWPAWVGLALLTLGAVGGGVRIGLRRRVARLAEPVVEGVPSAP
jgi:hypothetical protein